MRYPPEFEPVGMRFRRFVDASKTDARAAVARLWRALGFRFGSADDLAAT